MRLLAAMLFTQLACGSLPFAPAGPDDAPDPAKLGPFPVGVRTLVLLDADRPRPDGTPRSLVTEVWYPADESARDLPGVSYDVLSLLTEEQRARLAGAPVVALATRGVRDARPDRHHGPYPLVVFSHAHTGMRWQSSTFTAQLASHGFVVASSDHEGGTFYDALRGQLAPFLDGIETRPADVRKVIDELSRLPTGDPLAGLADTQRVGATGHSFGGMTAFRVAALDPRVAVVVPQAAVTAALAWQDRPQPYVLPVPVLMEAAHGDLTVPWDANAQKSWDLLHRPRWLLDITRGGHMTFSDLCPFELGPMVRALDLPELDFNGVFEDGCGEGAPTSVAAQPLITHFAIAALNGVLRQSPPSLGLLNQAAADSLASGVAVLTADP